MKERSGQSTSWLDRIGRHVDLIVPGILSLVAAAAIVVSRGFPKTAVSTDIGAGYFPALYSGLLIVLCVLLAANHLLARKSPQAAAMAPSVAASSDPGAASSTTTWAKAERLASRRQVNTCVFPRL